MEKVSEDRVAEIARGDGWAPGPREMRRLATELLELRRGAHNAALAFVELGTAQEEVRGLRADLAVVSAGVEGVWRWQGDGDDHPESLACPVVMSAETLRGLVGAPR